MILPFSTELNGKPTYFVEKIQKALTDTDFFSTPEIVPYEFKFDYYKSCIPKLHTIREDKNNRWKPGVIIDFFINTRTKDMFRFAPRIPVVSTQKIVIRHQEIMNDANITIDGMVLNYSQKEHLAQNDGFDSLKDFFAYFNEDFEGKIIHWTDFKY